MSSRRCPDDKYQVEDFTKRVERPIDDEGRDAIDPHRLRDRVEGGKKPREEIAFQLHLLGFVIKTQPAIQHDKKFLDIQKESPGLSLILGILL